jgi:hypothetical protein
MSTINSLAAVADTLIAGQYGLAIHRTGEADAERLL